MSTRPRRSCPRCDREYVDFPALSRRDNATDICPRCGEEEALIDAGLVHAGRAPADEVLARDEQFRNRVARHTTH